MKLTPAKKLAVELMQQHGLKNWRFEFDAAVRRFGCCDYADKKITLSRVLVKLNEEVRVKNTVLHEIAHALTPGTHHGPAWVQMARAIGCDGRRCYETEKVVGIGHTFTGKCGCDRTIQRHRRNRGLYCVTCRKRFVFTRNK